MFLCIWMFSPPFQHSSIRCPASIEPASLQTFFAGKKVEVSPFLSLTAPRKACFGMYCIWILNNAIITRLYFMQILPASRLVSSGPPSDPSFGFKEGRLFGRSIQKHLPACRDRGGRPKTCPPQSGIDTDRFPPSSGVFNNTSCLHAGEDHVSALIMRYFLSLSLCVFRSIGKRKPRVELVLVIFCYIHLTHSQWNRWSIPGFSYDHLSERALPAHTDTQTQ